MKKPVEDKSTKKVGRPATGHAPVAERVKLSRERMLKEGALRLNLWLKPDVGDALKLLKGGDLSATEVISTLLLKEAKRVGKLKR